MQTNLEIKNFLRDIADNTLSLDSFRDASGRTTIIMDSLPDEICTSTCTRYPSSPFRQILETFTVILKTALLEIFSFRKKNEIGFEMFSRR